MKALSFLPAATEIIYRLGLDEYLYGVTFECRSDKPKVVRSLLEGNNFSSEEIDNIVSSYKTMGKSLYYIDEALLQQIEPDIIFTQDVCEVCQIDTAYVQKAIHKLKKKPQLVPLVPKSLNDVFDNILTIGQTFGHEERAYNLLAYLKKRIDDIVDTLRKYRATPRRVMLIEWLNPIYNCGHWVPDQIALAGGIDMLSNPSGYSVRVDWEKILMYDPEILVVAPCGLNLERSTNEISALEELPNWSTLKAVKNDQVYFVDSDLFTCPSTRLIEGIELLACLFHPSIFVELKNHYQSYYAKMSDLKKVHV
ncbi:MAG: ABC transporter substrate-binding protein [Bacteroidia bacterium]|nr:ABC transporter substrate-binding protein [Bacteroidia bacterium]MDW8303034.1 ABC transporter substrate-binding protein [Bacteroidia bacterium]